MVRSHDRVLMISTKRRRFRIGHRRAVLAVTLVCVLAASAAAQERYHPALNPQHFPVPNALVPNINFWRETFSRYTSSQTVIHD
ncbi:MAG: hypothetical protein ACRD1Q_10020, partial [Vicinamibacterales bacterium]